MSTPTEQLYLPLQPEAVHHLQLTDSLTDQGYVHSVDLTAGRAEPGYNHLDLDPSHYHTREDGLHIPVQDVYSLTKIVYGPRSGVEMKDSRPKTYQLRVLGRVLTAASDERHLLAAAGDIMSLYPYDKPEQKARTDAIIIGDEPIERLGNIIVDRYGDSDSLHSRLALDALAYARSYSQTMLRAKQAA